MKVRPDRGSVQEVAKAGKARKPAEGPAADISGPEAGDKVRISSSAGEIIEIKAKIHSLPEVRENRVRELRGAIPSEGTGLAARRSPET